MINQPVVFAMGIVSAAVGGPTLLHCLPPWSGDADGLMPGIGLGIVLLILPFVLIPLSMKQSNPSALSHQG